MLFKSRPIAPWREMAIVLIAFTLISLWSAHLQQTRLEPRWDGASYLQMASQSQQGVAVSADEPFVYRVGWPWLVARLFPDNLVFGFEAMNILASAATTLVLALWLRLLGVRSLRVRLAMICLWLLAWHGPVRFVYFNPTLVDAPFLLLVTTGLYLIERLRAGYSRLTAGGLILVCFIGALCRETMLLIPLSLAWAANPIRLRLAGLVAEPADRPHVPIGIVALSLAAVIAGVMLARNLVVPTEGSYSAAHAALQMIRAKSMPALLLGVFTTFGPIVALVIFDWRQVIRTLMQRQYLAAYLLMTGVLAYIGGTDTERIMFWAMPVIYLLLGQAIERHWSVITRIPVLAVGLAAQLMSTRALLGIPHPDFDAHLGPASFTLVPHAIAAALQRVVELSTSYLSLWSFFASTGWRLAQLAAYLTMSLALFALLTRASSSKIARDAARR